MGEAPGPLVGCLWGSAPLARDAILRPQKLVAVTQLSRIPFRRRREVAATPGSDDHNGERSKIHKVSGRSVRPSRSFATLQGLKFFAAEPFPSFSSCSLL